MRGKLSEELLHRIREDRFQRNGDFKPDLAGWQHSWHAISGENLPRASCERLRPSGRGDLQVSNTSSSRHLTKIELNPFFQNRVRVRVLDQAGGTQRPGDHLVSK